MNNELIERMAREIYKNRITLPNKADISFDDIIEKHNNAKEDEWEFHEYLAYIDAAEAALKTILETHNITLR